MLATVILARRDGGIDVTRLLSDRAPDLSSVDHLARLVLAARRAGCPLRLEGVSPRLVVLLDLTGLSGILGGPTLLGTADEFCPAGTSYGDKGGTLMPAATSTIRVQRVHTVGIPVTDQDRALRFYVDTLGFAILRDVPLGGGTRWIEVAPPEGTATLALVASSALTPAGVETGVRLTSQDVPGDHDALAAEGVAVDDVLIWEGVPPMFAFRDPDGNRLELVGEV